MAINATTNSVKKDPIPSGNYAARCYQMIHIGTIEEDILGKKKVLNKVRIGWELPTEMKVFNEDKGEQPLVISEEFTLSMHEKSTLRKFLASWRGQDFSEDEAKCFDVSKLLGVPCLLNIIHKPAKKDPNAIYAKIGSISPLPKGFNISEQINKTFVLDYDDFSIEKFNTLPDFIKLKMQSSIEYAAMQQPHVIQTQNAQFDQASEIIEPLDDLPF